MLKKRMKKEEAYKRQIVEIKKVEEKKKATKLVR